MVWERNNYFNPWAQKKKLFRGPGCPPYKQGHFKYHMSSWNLTQQSHLMSHPWNSKETAVTGCQDLLWPPLLPHPTPPPINLNTRSVTWLDCLGGLLSMGPPRYCLPWHYTSAVQNTTHSMVPLVTYLVPVLTYSWSLPIRARAVRGHATSSDSFTQLLLLKPVCYTPPLLILDLPGREVGLRIIKL